MARSTHSWLQQKVQSSYPGSWAVNSGSLSKTFGHPNDDLSPRLLTAALSDSGNPVRDGSATRGSGSREHKSFAINRSRLHTRLQDLGL
jgi:hypothetical protein